MNKNKIKIFVCYHKESPIFQNDIFTPIQVGKALSSCDLGITSDAEGDNISAKNRNFCELTAQYWAWKNIQADYIGFFHYRRVFSFSDSQESVFDVFDAETINEFGWQEDNISNMCSSCDLILPEKMQMNISIYDQYEKNHNRKDLDIIETLINQKYPQMKSACKKALSCKEAYFYNMFIMKKEFFNEYMSFLFDVLLELESLIDISSYNSYQSRVFGFLSERLLNIYVEYLKETQNSLNIKELKVLTLLEPKKKITFTQKILSKTKENNRTILRILGLKFSIRDKIK